jgi:hypothetical protein
VRRKFLEILALEVVIGEELTVQYDAKNAIGAGGDETVTATVKLPSAAWSRVTARMSGWRCSPAAAVGVMAAGVASTAAGGVMAVGAGRGVASAQAVRQAAASSAMPPRRAIIRMRSIGAPRQALA